MESFKAVVEAGSIRLVLDTNVYLDCRQAVGYDEDGYLLAIDPVGPMIPALAVVLAPTLAGRSVEFVISPVVRNELFQLLSDGYDQCPVGIGDGFVTADVLDELVELHPPGSWSYGSRHDPMELPNPPLSDAEKNDRRIYAQAVESDALLITSDTRLLEAVRTQHRLEPGCALRPRELVALAKRVAQSAD